MFQKENVIREAYNLKKSHLRVILDVCITKGT